MRYSVEQIMNNPDITHIPGKIVIRPDSGDPVNIICGRVEEVNGPDREGRYNGKFYETNYFGNHGRETEIREYQPTPADKGVIELLWDMFGGKINSHGYKELDPHVGAIYGDSITLDRADRICKRLKAKGFASTNIVFGVGSYTYQYNTRDTFGFAVKATYGEIKIYKPELHNGLGIVNRPVLEPREIFKDPITDDGTKKSAKGLLYVGWDAEKKEYHLIDQVSREVHESEANQLMPVFKDGKILKQWSLSEIRERIKQG